MGVATGISRGEVQGMGKAAVLHKRWAMAWGLSVGRTWRRGKEEVKGAVGVRRESEREGRGEEGSLVKGEEEGLLGRLTVEELG
ncbi:hypothetical protein GOBAR_DD20502 [Gossypium barbadense]|nr:hypothetical protein GOBAR_DD20502 [Gossypium barbadense]